MIPKLLADAASTTAAGRAALPVWSDFVTAMRRAAESLLELGHVEQAAALERDRGHIMRRAELHLRGIVAAETRCDVTGCRRASEVDGKCPSCALRDTTERPTDAE